jgi:hypothetical protein
MAKKVMAPCSVCIGSTSHEVVHDVSWHTEDGYETNATLQCGGCGTVCLGKFFRDVNGDVDAKYYPSPVSRRKPPWIYNLEDQNLGDLLGEIYAAVDGGQHRLAAMGIRALLEQVMVVKAGDEGTFEKNIDKFQEMGFISLIQRDAMKETIEVGHGAIHRAFAPNEKELNKSLDIVEGIMAAVFDHIKAAGTLANRVPPRKKP